MTTKYFKEVDLAALATPGNPINNPLDPRAHHDFCFESDSQEVILVQPPQAAGTQPYRVFISYDCGHFALIQPGPILPPLPPGVGPEIHGVLQYDPIFGISQPDEQKVFKRECCSLSRHLKVWLDPLAPPPTAQMIVVRVMASARGGSPCCPK